MSNREAVLDLLNELLLEAEDRRQAGQLAYFELAGLLAKPESTVDWSWRDELEKALGLGGERALVRSAFREGDVQEVKDASGPSLGTYWNSYAQRWIPRSDPDWDVDMYRRCAMAGEHFIRMDESRFRDLMHQMAGARREDMTEAIISFLARFE